MEEHDLNQLLDLAAFIEMAAEEGQMDKETILRHVAHDVNGIRDPIELQEGHCWIPRTKGWLDARLQRPSL